MSFEEMYQWLFIGALLIFGIYILVALIRCIKGPETCDRILAVNMIGTAVVCCIAILSVLLKEGYLCDICLIYVLINCLSVTILTKVYMKRKTGRKG